MSSGNFEVVDTGLKRDHCGRRLESREERERILAEYDTSCLTQRAFAEREGIAYNTFAWWLKQRRERRRSPGTKCLDRKASSAMTFAECKVSVPKAQALLEVQLIDGTLVRGGDATALADLVKALRC